jgi:hypothetical protein
MPHPQHLRVAKKKKGSTSVIKTIGNDDDDDDDGDGDDGDEGGGVPVQGLPRMANWAMSSATQPAATKRIQK